MSKSLFLFVLSPRVIMLSLLRNHYFFCQICGWVPFIYHVLYCLWDLTFYFVFTVGQLSLTEMAQCAFYDFQDYFFVSGFSIYMYT